MVVWQYICSVVRIWMSLLLTHRKCHSMPTPQGFLREWIFEKWKWNEKIKIENMLNIRNFLIIKGTSRLAVWDSVQQIGSPRFWCDRKFDIDWADRWSLSENPPTLKSLPSAFKVFSHSFLIYNVIYNNSW